METVYRVTTGVIADVMLSDPDDTKRERSLRIVRARLAEPAETLKEKLADLYQSSTSRFVKVVVAPFINMTPQTFSDRIARMRRSSVSASSAAALAVRWETSSIIFTPAQSVSSTSRHRRASPIPDRPLSGLTNPCCGAPPPSPTTTNGKLALRSTPAGRESRRTTPTAKRSTAASGRI
jgi:hypothetical protein